MHLTTRLYGILTGYPVTLDQGRYTWRHDSVLQVLIHTFKLYAGLQEYLASVYPPSTIPTNLSSTLSRPELVLVPNNSNCLFELTIPTNCTPSNIFWLLELGRKINIDVYSMTLAYLLISFLSRLACLGHFMPDTIAQVANACEVTKKTIRSLFEQAAHIAISRSYRFFNSTASGPRTGNYRSA